LINIFNNVKDSITANKDAFESFFDVVKTIAPIIGTIIGGALSVIGEIAGVVIDLFAKVLGVIKPILDFAIDAVNQIIRGINLIKPGADIPPVKGITSTPGTFSSISGVLGGSAPTIKAPTPPKITVPSSSAGLATASASAAKASASPITIGGSATERAGAFSEVYVTVNQGIVGDPEAAARSVVDVLNRSFYRGSGGANALVLTQ
jgi:hypothetical protein